jgi:sulfur-oxidizing protein SoxY
MTKTHLARDTQTKMAIVGAVGFVSILGVGPCLAGYNYTDPEREARWQDLRTEIFGTRAVRTDDTALALDAPETALDAAVVPVTITLAHPKDVTALTLIIDDNPSPVAARFTFGPDADPATIKLRVRVNHLTAMRAIAETRDGALSQTVRLVKASGGCSAPMGVSDEEAMRGMGQMKLRLAGTIAADRPVEATLMIRHPNFNGMQMNEALQVFTPARYIQTIDVTFQDKKVFSLATDISLSSNPVITFGLRPSAGEGKLKVEVKDSKAETWSKTFPVPSLGD